MDRTEASGRFVLRLEPALHARLRERARAAGVSLNEYCVRQLARPGPETVEPVDAAVAHARGVLGESLIGVVAFGSWARGEAGEKSDVDLLIVAEATIPITRELYRRWDAGAPRWEGRVLEPHFVHAPDPDARPSGFWAEVAVDGIVLFERDHAISRRLGRVRAAIAAGVIVRRSARGHSYWVAA